jgi:hypothetical protein
MDFPVLTRFFPWFSYGFSNLNQLSHIESPLWANSVHQRPSSVEWPKRMARIPRHPRWCRDGMNADVWLGCLNMEYPPVFWSKFPHIYWWTIYGGYSIYLSIDMGPKHANGQFHIVWIWMDKCLDNTSIYGDFPVTRLMVTQVWWFISGLPHDNCLVVLHPSEWSMLSFSREK